MPHGRHRSSPRRHLPLVCFAAVLATEPQKPPSGRVPCFSILSGQFRHNWEFAVAYAPMMKGTDGDSAFAKNTAKTFVCPNTGHQFFSDSPYFALKRTHVFDKVHAMEDYRE